MFHVPECSIQRSSWCHSKKLERVQRSSAREVCRLHKYQRISMTEVHHHLHWQPVALRIKYQLLNVTFKALRSGTPK